MSVSAHKMYGPKGVGALYVRRQNPRVQLTAQMDGGGHEGGMRSGTLNVPGIVGFGEACAIAAREMAEEYPRIRALRDRLKSRLLDGLEGVHIHGSMEHRLAGNLICQFRRRGRRCTAGRHTRRGGFHGQRLQFPWRRRKPRAARHRRVRRK